MSAPRGIGDWLGGANRIQMRPLFYENPVALHPQAHGQAGLLDHLNYGFAARTNAVPLTMSEFPMAALNYPIAFTIEGGVRPVAVLGLRDDENLFVDRAGDWTQGAYIPAYVRRYPFILSEYGEGEGVQLCIDDTPKVLVREGGQRLFQGEEPTPMLEKAFNFCRSVHAADLATSPFVEALIACGVLEARSAEVEMPDGGKINMAGFASIDEAKFRSLPDEVFLTLRRQGWITAIYAQLQSTLNWGRLGDLLVTRQG